MSEIAVLPTDWRPVVADVCRRHRMGILNVIKRSRRPRVVRCRFDVWMELWRQGVSFSAIGRRFGYDRTSVLHGVRRAIEREKYELLH